ncbi:MAG TPA: hypothetical protein VHM91_08595 [Verrucomicrobiales bacterium]|nr:hypothetical protein [Verrucomicrobiales bacterium]
MKFLLLGIALLVTGCQTENPPHQFSTEPERASEAPDHSIPPVGFGQQAGRDNAMQPQ